MDPRFVVVVEDEGGRTDTHARKYRCAGEEAGCQAPPSTTNSLETDSLTDLGARQAVSKFQFFIFSHRAQLKNKLILKSNVERVRALQQLDATSIPRTQISWDSAKVWQ